MARMILYHHWPCHRSVFVSFRRRIDAWFGGIELLWWRTLRSLPTQIYQKSEFHVLFTCKMLSTQFKRSVLQGLSRKRTQFVIYILGNFRNDNEYRNGNRAFSHDVTAAILVFQNNRTAAMLVYQDNPVGVELFSYVKTFFCSNKLA